MNQKIEYVDVTPHKSLMPKMGRSGYSVPQAIAELVDNSIDARKEEKLDIKIEVKENLIEIKDNGVGMGKEDLTKAFSLAHSSKEDQLGEFGLGLKTSCQSLGSYFEILTTKEGDPNYYLISYDEEIWLKNNEHSWGNYPIKILDKSEIKEHGTKVTIKKLKVKPSIAIIKKDLGTRFSPFLVKKAAEIQINGIKTNPFEPELDQEGRTNFEIEVNKTKIKGWYGLMKESSQKGYYGFHVFRRGRMITSYDKIGIPEHATVARIIGEIHLDHIPVTHNKREFIKTSEEYFLAEEALRLKFRELVKKARQSTKDDKVTKKVKEGVDNWKSEIIDALKTPELKDLLKREKKIKKPSKEGKIQEEVDIEKREEWKFETPPLNIKEKLKLKEKSRNPKKTHKNRHKINLKGQRFDFNVEYAHLGSKDSQKKWSVSKANGIEVVINTDFPSWLSTKDTVFYVVSLVAEGLAEIISKESNEWNPEKILEIKEEILRKSSELKNQFEEEVEEKKDEYGEKTSFLNKEEKFTL